MPPVADLPINVEDLPVSSAPLEERRVAAMEKQAEALLRHAVASERMLSLHQAVGAPIIASDPRDRFERVLCACVSGRIGTTPSVEGFLTFARELCDGIDREFPPTAPTP